MFKKLNIVGGFLASLVGGFSVQSMEVERFSADQKSTKIVPEMLSEENRIFNYWALEQMTGENFPKDVKDYIAKCYVNVLGKPEKLDGDFEIYVAAGYSPVGEPMYFSMEKLDYKNYQTWLDYANSMDLGGNRNPVVNYLQLITDFSDDESKYLNLESCWNGRDYMRKIRGLVRKLNLDREKVVRLSRTIAATQSGTIAFKELLPSGENVYVAYVSKTPIKGCFSPKSKFDLINPLGEQITEDFEKAYGDMIMCVVVRDNIGTATTTHRGIFKNPFYHVWGGYKNISLKLHGWAGTVAHEYFDNKKYMLVQPDVGMMDILLREFKIGEMFREIDEKENSESVIVLQEKDVARNQVGACKTIIANLIEKFHCIEIENHQILTEFLLGETSQAKYGREQLSKSFDEHPNEESTIRECLNNAISVMHDTVNTIQKMLRQTHELLDEKSKNGEYPSSEYLEDLMNELTKKFPKQVGLSRLFDDTNPLELYISQVKFTAIRRELIGSSNGGSVFGCEKTCTITIDALKKRYFK